jgi:hypothetical protein
MDPLEYYQFMGDLKRHPAEETGLSSLRLSQQRQIALLNRLEPQQPKGKNVLELLATLFQPAAPIPPPDLKQTGPPPLRSLHFSSHAIPTSN